MAMPEAAVDKNDRLSLLHYNIRLPWETGSVQAIPVSHASEQSAYDQLGLGVLGHDTPHALRPLLWRQRIH